MNLGEKIKFLREKKGLTQQELSKLSGVNRATIGNYERGARIPNIEILKKLSHALDTDINTLTNLENKNAWVNNILNGDNIIGIDKKSFLEADPSRREALLNDLSQISLFQAKINKFSDLVNKSDSEELKNAYTSLLQDITKELTIKDELTKLYDAFYAFVESVNNLNAVFTNPTFIQNGKNTKLSQYSSQLFKANAGFLEAFSAYLLFPRNLVNLNWEEKDKIFFNNIQNVIDFNRNIVEVLNGNQEE